MRLLSLLFFLSMGLSAHAVMVSDLYAVQVPVADQLAESRKVALQEALQQVVVKVTGSAQAMQSPDIQAQNSQADRFVKSFRYSKHPIDNSLILDVVFAQDLLDKLLIQAKQPIWSKSRPLLLLWQGVEEKNQRRALAAETGRWQLLFEQAFNERGLPLLWPTQDGEDQQALPLSSLWALSTTSTEQASKRYLADAQVVASLKQLSDGSFVYQGILLNKSDRLMINAQDNTALGLARKVADQLAQFLASRYAITSMDIASGLQIDIAGIQNFQQYQDVLNYLKGNIAIKQLRLISVQQQRMRLELELSAPWEQVWSMLALDKRLTTSDQPLLYYWQH